MAYLDYVGLAYFKSLLDENYLRTDYSGDTTIQGNVTFTEPMDADVKNDYLGNQIDKTYIKDIILDPEGSGALALVLGDGSVSHLLTNTTVSQVRSFTNELYPVLLCHDANAEEAQITKTVKYVHDVQINPSTGYISAKGMYVKHPTFNRRNSVTQKVEWAYDFTDGVSGLGNPMSQVYAYVDPVAQGGEHCIELRLYGNPNVSPTVPSINDSTNTFSIGVGVTGGNVQFGYCPSTPLYLDDGSTLRTEATGHGNDIITRDWLNLNGSLTGLVHTTMNETIDGAKTFKKTVTINSGDNNKAGLYVQGNSDVHGNEHVYGTETVDGKLTVNGTTEIKGGSENIPSLTVTGDERVTGNSSITGNSNIGGNSSVTGNETVSGKITGNNGAEINGGNGLVVNGNETVNGEIYKLINNTPQEYVSYVTNKQETKTTIVNNLIKNKGGLAVDDNKNIYVNLRNGGGIVNDNGFLRVDFSVNDDDDAAQELLNQTKFAILSSLSIQIPLTVDKTVIVDKNHSAATTIWRNSQGVIDSTIGTENKPFKTIQSAVDYITQGFSVGARIVTIAIKSGTYSENVILPAYSVTSGQIHLVSYDSSNRATIVNPDNTAGIIYCSGKNWYLYNLNLEGTYFASNNGINNFHIGFGISSNASCYIQGCAIKVNYTGNAPTSGLSIIRVISLTTGGLLVFNSSDDSVNSIEYHKGNASLTQVIFMSDSSQIIDYGANSASANVNIEVFGECDVFANIGANCMVSFPLDRLYQGKFVVPVNKSATGKCYNIGDFAAVYLNQTSFPGNIEGTTSTYGIYSGLALE